MKDETMTTCKFVQRVVMDHNCKFLLVLHAFLIGTALFGAARAGAAAEAECQAPSLQLRASATARRNASGHWLLDAALAGSVASRPGPRLALDASLDVSTADAASCAGHGQGGWAALRTSAVAHAAPQGYEPMPFGPKVTSFYRLHTNALPWSEAAALCRKEGAHLLVINSDAEALVVKEFFFRKPAFVGAINEYWMAAGFRRFLGRNETVLGGSLESSGYNKWAPFDGQWKLSPVTDCGAIDRRLLYALEDCKNARGFICEMEM